MRSNSERLIGGVSITVNLWEVGKPFFLCAGVSITVKLWEVGKPVLLCATFKKIKIIDLENINKKQLF